MGIKILNFPTYSVLMSGGFFLFVILMIYYSKGRIMKNRKR